MNETDVAKPVVDYLRSQQWDVHQEVGHGGRVADIVAVRGPLIYVVEVKTRLSWKLVDQIMGWRGLAHYRSIVTPGSSMPACVRKLASVDGFGVLFPPGYNFERQVRIEISPQLCRKASVERWRRNLCDETRTYAAAGSPGGGHWSPFKRTCQVVLAYVTANPGALTRDVIENMGEHHYGTDATARSTLAKWADQGVIDGVRVEREGRLLRWYPVTTKKGTKA